MAFVVFNLLAAAALIGIDQAIKLWATHVLQPIGYQGDVPVVYSLGNYLFNSKTLDSCLVEAVIGDEGLESLRFIPAKQSNCRVAKAEGAEKERIINYMRSISPEAVIDDEGYITKQNAQ